MASSSDHRISSPEGDDDMNESTCSEYPLWLQKLLEYFVFCDQQKRTVKEGDKVRIRVYYTLSCTFCKDNASVPSPRLNKKKKEDPGKVQGNSAWAFVRHLERLHKGLYDEQAFQDLCKNTSLKKKRSLDEDDEETIVTSVIGLTGSESDSKPAKRYDPRGSKQQKFNKHVLDFIALDGVPLSVSEGKGFRQLIKSIDNGYTCPSKSSNSRLLAKKNSDITKHMSKTLGGLKMGSAHLMLDIWSSQSKMSVIGVMVRYIHNWKLHQHTLGFRHFPGTHDGARFQETLETMLRESFGMSMYDFLTVTADNASSILAAFRDLESKQPLTNVLDENETQQDEINLTLETEQASSSSALILDLPEDELLDVGEDPAEVVDNFVNNDQIEGVMDSVMDSVIAEWLLCEHTYFRKTRNSCLAHLLQLGIKDALNHAQVAAIVKKGNTIVKWFHKSNKFYTELKDLAGLSLVKPCDTRWNSLYHCLKRLCREVSIFQGTVKVQVQIVKLVNTVLLEAKSTTKRVPSGISDDRVSALNFLVQLLKPFAVLTDLYQGDGVTSSSVILGFVDAIRALDDVQLQEFEGEDDDEDTSYMKDFKQKLKVCVLQRFETDRGKGQKVNGRNIVTTDIFNDQFYILATILDPRSKTVPFEEGFATGLNVLNQYPTKENAIKILKEAIKNEKFNCTGVEVIREIQHTSSAQQTSVSQNRNEANNEVTHLGKSSNSNSSPASPPKKRGGTFFHE